MNSNPSKSAKKREAHAIEALARRLLELTDAQLADIPMDDELRAVVNDTRVITARSALRRQRLYLAKQLRSADVTDIVRACDALDRSKLGNQKLFHQAERWRDRLLAERNAALGEFEALTGNKNPDLEKLLAGLAQALPEARERHLARELFREIHKDLARFVQDDASKR